ncbi:hypothetical protein NEMBOFW57_000922 [Staphylotrichum longicolle]|uniref:Protein kinase domain-containing protein n=1 Tax=Staphylotrichum longicolle TaxID=669026 RepID=A0AAD4F3K8_9PEZI|nr:hypothetical protein NEMBOFW57_000922 [Staphylotrichum longicolle]
MASTVQTATPPSLVSPGIQVEFHGDPNARPAPIYPQRTPSAHREIKETLNARSEYTNEDSEGGSHHHINQYAIGDEIGRGSYGAVHLATDQFGNEYAVKAFSKARLRKRAQSNILRQGPRQLGRFPRAGFGAPDSPRTGYSDQRAKEAKDALYLIREEVAIMKKLNHPNLVQLIEVLDDPEDDTLYMVLEMCKKGVVMKVGLGEAATPYDEEKCRYWFRDLILGIEYLHSQGVVHRDIKPENLLLTDDDVLKIVDFGVSEMFEKSDDMRTAKSAGSPAFLPPELCVAKHGDVSGKAADIWSMGVSLYCLRYGRIPFEREGVLEMYEAIKTETPKLPSGENPDFVDLMQALLEKDPEKRITMAELREHPWVTKGGTDPLLSTEENCSDPVDPPNSLELNHAFTRKMSHLICVMKAIRKFKSLIPPRTPSRSNDPKHLAPLLVPPSPAPEEKASAAQSTAEFAARVLRERQEFLAKGGSKASLDHLLHASANPTTTSSSSQFSSSSSSNPHHEDHHQPTLLLGIGTGGIDDFSHSHSHPHDRDDHDGAPAADIVSDSPTVVDFNVYDRAFTEEVERIKRSTSRKGGSAGAGAGSRGKGGAVGEIYQTRFSEQRSGNNGDINGGGGGTTGLWGIARAGAGSGVGGVVGQEKGEQRAGMRFAELVAKAMGGAGAGGPGGKENRGDEAVGEKPC